METARPAPREFPKWFAFPHSWLFLFVFLNLIAGVFIAKDFGESTDEAFERARARVALKMYSFPDAADREQAYRSLNGPIRYYGTAQSALFELAEQKIAPLLGASPGTITHYGYFVSFQVGVVAIFYLVSAFTSPWAALAVSVLFSLQPLFFGHAFINPKDIPLMAIFTAVVAAGFHLSRKMSPIFTPYSLPLGIWRTAIGDKGRWRKTFKSTAWLLILGGLLVIFKITAEPLAAALIPWLYHAPPASLPEKLFGSLASNPDAASLAAYLQKGQNIATRLSTYALAGWLVLFLLVFSILLLKKRPADNPVQSSPSAKSGTFLAEIKAIPAGIYWASAAAGALWGFAIATRVIALAAGGIVGLCLLLEFRRRALLPLLVYTLSAAVVGYAAWPFLWVFGLEGLYDSLTIISAHPWSGIVLFDGEIYPAGTLPEYYLIKLIALQLTLPVVVLSAAGLLLGIYLAARQRLPIFKFLLLLAWFALPILYTVILNTAQYDNFRQYLFVLPPLFVFVGIFLAWLQARIPWKLLLPALTLVFVLPAVISLVRLHPYQYIYYNPLVGGVEGAFRDYELDYWLTSYRHAAEWVDENVPPGSSILVWGGERRIRPFVENEFEYYNPNHVAPEEYDQFDYVIVTTEYLLDTQYHLSAAPVFAIERDNVPLVFVKRN
ncbi:MAG: hypothetical protein PVI99_07925 [Anaerolineales bacterium]|jgi:hypothetical protein